MAVLTTLLEFLTPPNAIFCFVASMATSSVRMDSTRCSGARLHPWMRQRFSQVAADLRPAWATSTAGGKP